ncbi:MAG TPA: serine hydrolase domain-containing protein, partial [Vicinamibacterales bacterium]|nr:serine hydrolase domain-containing protein [Vicinamibacterales bacterium]
VTLVARRGRIAHLEAQGLMDLSAKRAMRRDALFSIASMSKPVTAVAVLMMVEEGRLHLRDPVSMFIPQFHGMKVAASATPGRDITVEDLLTHVSGLMSGGPISAGELPAIDHRKGEALADFIPRLGSTTLDFAPGTRWSYSPLAGFDTLGRLVEIASGQRFDHFLRQRIFDPLGMRETTFLPSAEQITRLTTMYHRSKSAGPLTPAADDGWLTNVAPTYFSGAGGLFSTAEDYARFAQMLLNRGELDGTRLLRSSSVDLLSSVFVPETVPGRLPGIGFGLGVRVYQTTSDNGVHAGSYGWDGSYGTHFWIDPKEQLVGILMIQDDNPDFQLGRDFERAASQAIVE